MSEKAGFHSAFIDCINQSRNEVLDQYVVSVHSQGGRFLQEDRLILMVRAGTFLDALLNNLSDKRMDRMSAYVTAHTNQLLASGYSIERISLMYDLLGQALLSVANHKLQEQPGLATSIRSVKAVMQLARMVAVNLHLAKVSHNMHERKGFSSPDGSVAPRTLTGSKPAQSRQSNGATRLANNKNSSDGTNDLKPGYLLWPLQVMYDTTPAEYKAYLSDGTYVQVLLVDRLEIYAPPDQSNSNTASCLIRQLGPVTLAYPLFPQ